MEVKDRILLFIKAKGITTKRFEEICSLSNGYVSSMRKGLGAEKLNNVLTAFPDINREWLLFGEGNMLKSATPQIITGANSGIVAQNNSGNVYNAPTDGAPSAENTEEIPVIPRQLYEETEVDVFEYISENEVPTSPKVEQFPHFDAYYNVYGDEMMPEFKPGDKLAIAPYEAGMERKVLDGRTYVIDTKYNGLLLRVLRKAEGGFVAIPYNNKYSEEFIENEDIKSISRVLGLIRTNV